jgi:hypothetical protein
MSLVPIRLPPGLERNGSPYDTPDRYWDTNLVRWQSGNMIPVGGWNKLTAAPLDSAVRKIHVYRDNSNQRHILIGTSNKLWADVADVYTDITPAAFVPLQDIITTGGYGTGTYGSGTYGTPRSGTFPAFSPYAYWSFDDWGEDIIMTANSDGRLFYYVTATATVAPGVITTAPIGNAAVCVTQERHVMAIGQTGGSGSAYRVAWSSREDYTDWDFASLTNTAGFQDLDAHAPLLRAVQVREGQLIFGQSDIYLAQYVGQPFIYGFTRLADAQMFHPDSIAAHNGKAAWMEASGFKLYNAGAIGDIPCPILADVFEELDPSYGRFRFHGSFNGVFPEVWWFYPTTGHTEANRYVMLNLSEGWWAWGMLSRSAMFPATTYRYPYMGDASGNFFEHENGLTDAGNPRWQDIFAETGALSISQDNTISDINQIQAAALGPTLQVLAYGQYTPNGAETTFGPYIPRSDGYTDCRISARNVRLRFQPRSDDNFGIGTWYLDIPKVSGARR